MKISVDDWHFRERTEEPLVLDVFLDNGQHALLEVNSMRNPSVVNGDIPELIVFCELPGEKIASENCPARWIARPPNRSCPWSNVQLPMALNEQIKARLKLLASPLAPPQAQAAPLSVHSPAPSSTAPAPASSHRLNPRVSSTSI